MAEIEPLISTSQLKTTFLASLPKNKQPRLFVNYDSLFDALMLLVVSRDTETVVHYIDDHVALLYKPDDLEIVGLQIEAFEHSFVPQHENVQRVWRLSDAGVKFEDLGDIVFAVERLQPKLAREIVKATEDILGEPGVELAAVFA